MKRTIFIIHGSNGSPKENWFPWLKKKLEKLGHQVFVPRFPVPTVPTPGGHKLDQWFKTFEEYEKYVNKSTIFIAHSRGTTFTFHLIPHLRIKIDSLFLVGSFTDYFRWKPDFYEKFDTFQSKPYQWNAIKKFVKYMEVYQSSNDVIPIPEGELIANNLGAKFILVKNAGHFNVAEDKKFVKFPLLLENIKKRLRLS